MRKFVLICGLLSLFAGSARAQAHQNAIAWTASTGTVTGYNVYRFAGACAGTPLTSFTKLTATPITVLTFTDSGMADGAMNCYFVTAVGTDTNHTESQSSGTLQLTSPVFTANVAPPPPGKPTSVSQ